MFNSKVKQEPVKKATHINDSSFISYCPLASDERVVSFQDGQSVSIKRASDKHEGRFAKLTNFYFKNNHLSKEHAKIRYDQQQGFYIQDANSTFGTVLNNEKVLIAGVEHLLNTNDTVGLIMSKTSLQIKKITQEFVSANSADKEIRSIPISKFDNPTIVLNFRIEIKDSVLKLVPIERDEARVTIDAKTGLKSIYSDHAKSLINVEEIPDDTESSDNEVEVVDIDIVSNPVTKIDSVCFNGHISDDQIIEIDISDDELVSGKQTHSKENKITESDCIGDGETQKTLSRSASVEELTPTDRVESHASKMIVEVPSSEYEDDESDVNEIPEKTEFNWKEQVSDEVSDNDSSGESLDSELSNDGSSDESSDSVTVNDIKNKQDEISISSDESELSEGECGDCDQTEGDNSNSGNHEPFYPVCYRLWKDDRGSKYYNLLDKHDDADSDSESELDTESTLFGSNCDEVDDIKIAEDNKLVDSSSIDLRDDFDEITSQDQSSFNEISFPRNFCLSRKRRFDELDSFDEFGRHTPIEYSDCEFSNQPPRKKYASTESKWKTITKEVGKGLFYVFATIAALGIYGSSIANEES